MKKLISILMALCLTAAIAAAGMEDIQYTFPASSSTTGTAVQSKTYVLRGEIETIYIDVTGLTTGTVAVTSCDVNKAVTNTIFSKALITADCVYQPRLALHTTGGAAYTWLSSVTNDNANVITNSFLGKAAVAGPVTVTFTGQAASTSTNDVDVTIIYKRD